MNLSYWMHIYKHEPFILTLWYSPTILLYYVPFSNFIFFHIIHCNNNKLLGIVMCIVFLCVCQRFCRAGGYSLTVRSLQCCCSPWAAKLNPTRPPQRKVCDLSSVASHLNYSCFSITTSWPQLWKDLLQKYVLVMVAVFVFFRCWSGKLQPSGYQHYRDGSRVQVSIRWAYICSADLVTSLQLLIILYKAELRILCFCFFQRCPGARHVSSDVPFREWPMGRSALCSGHWPGFWWAERSVVGNIWPGQTTFLFVYLFE